MMLAQEDGPRIVEPVRALTLDHFKMLRAET